MSGQLFDKYGAILAEDVEVLEACLAVIDRENFEEKMGPMSRPVRVLEIGMHDGGTARGIEKWLADVALRLDYTGIDPDDGTTRPRYVPEGGRVIVGDSAEVFGRVTGTFDLVWVDGCHCFNHVVLDTLHYSHMVRPGGFICFHDVNPRGQGCADKQPHGPDTPEFHLAVVDGLSAIAFPWAGWSLFMEKCPDDVLNCGTRAYRRTA